MLICCCCCCSAYLSSCHRTASDANLLDDPHTFHSIDYFVIGGIHTCLGVSDRLHLKSCVWYTILGVIGELHLKSLRINFLLTIAHSNSHLIIYQILCVQVINVRANGYCSIFMLILEHLNNVNNLLLTK